MKLKKIIKDIPIEGVKGSKEIEITGVCSNSKLVGPGNLFIAKRGGQVDGAKFIPEAISAGAIAILTDLYDPTLKNITQIIHKNVSAIEPLIVAQFNQFPSENLFMVGITGTNGKTTTAYLTKHLLDRFHGPCGLIGTIEYIIGNHTYQATRTTPDVATNQKLLREMVNFGCKSAVMEVTSHALEQHRVDQIHYDAAVFTNLTPEHLDYHHTMEAYALAKSKLFKTLGQQGAKKDRSPIAIVNRDDSYHEKILEGCSASVLTFAIDRPADLRASSIVLSTSGTEFILEYKNEKIPIKVPLIGRYNVYNSLAALACGISQKIPLENLRNAFSEFSSVPARLESVPNPLNLKIYVDFAHKTDALENVLKCLRELNAGKIITIFGCGGDRDKLKRPAMAKVCQMHSDFCIVTSDNPRSEDPEAIIVDIVKGFDPAYNYICEIDRRKAIEKAIEMANRNDIILIAGKGHETSQIFAHHTIEFDDRVVARESCILK